MDQAAAKTNAKPSNREYIEALYLLFNIGSTEALTRIFHVPIPFRCVKSCNICIIVPHLQFRLLILL